jgi:dTDP-glucose 4,6-dehydratase
MAHPLSADLNEILRRGADLWEDLRGARLFITGGTGFYGKWLLESLAWVNAHLRLGVEAVVLTRRSQSFRSEAPHLASDSAIHLHEGDIRTFPFPEGKYTHLIHAATPASADLNRDNPDLMLDLIIQGTRRALEFARHASIPKVLYASSGAVYGRQPPALAHVTEDHSGGPDWLEPRSAYALGKCVGEHLCATFLQQHGVQTTIARGFAFVGPYLPLDTHFAIGNFLRDGLRGGPIRVAGDGAPYRSYLYAADLAVWLWTILLRGQPCRAYNVGNEEGISIASLAQQIARCFGVEAHIATAPTPGKPPERYVPSTRRAREELGLNAWTGLEEAIDRSVRWHQATCGGRPDRRCA